MAASCSQSYERGSPSGERLQPPQLARISPPSRNLISHEADFDLYVLDYFFVSSVAVAVSFAEIFDRWPIPLGCVSTARSHM